MARRDKEDEQKTVKKVILPENEIPKQWYNVLADMPNKPEPYFSSVTNKMATPDELEVIFLKN